MRSKFCEQASVGSQRQFSSLNYILNQYRRWVVKKTRIATIALLLGLGGGGWATTEAIAPQIAQAETKRLDISLYRQSEEPYEALINRAETAANEAVRESFEQGTQVTDVSVTVVGHHMGAIAPVLSLGVSRSEWQRNPNVKSWSNYFSSARSLLRLDEDLANTTPSQSNTSTTNPSNRTQSSPNTNSTPRQTQSSPNSSSTPGQTQSPPIPASAREGNNNSLTRPPENFNSPTTPGGQSTNSTSGQSGNSISPTSPNSNSPSTGISSPETLTPSTIEPQDNFQNQSAPSSSGGGGLPLTPTPVTNPQAPQPVPSGIRGTTTDLEGR